MREPSLQTNLSVIGSRIFLLLPTFIFAAITFVTHVAKIVDLRFDHYAFAASLVTALSLILWLYFATEEARQIEIKDNLIGSALVLLGLFGSFLASIYHLPNSDDPFYVANAAHYLSFPMDRMGNEVHFLYSKDEPIYSVVALTSGAFEYAQALFASAFNLDYLTVYHGIGVACIGFAIPVSMYLLLSHFAVDPRDALVATCLSMLALPLLGDTIFTLGSHSFTRIFQGKSVFLTTGIPLFSSLALSYLDQASIRKWAYLLIAAVAMSGLSSSVFFMLPMLTLSIGGAYLLTFPIERQSLVDTALLGSSLVYAIIYGLYASFSTSGFRELSNPISWKRPDDFIGNLHLFLDADLPITPIVTVAAVALLLFSRRNVVRTFLLIWTGMNVLLFINPIVAPFWMKYVTSHYIYWRVFLLIPLPFMLGALFVFLFERIRRNDQKLLVSLLMALGLIGPNFVPGFPSIYQRGDHFCFPCPTVDQYALRVSTFVAENSPNGPMLAPPAVAGVTTMLEGGHPQLHLSKPYPLFDLLSNDDAELRARASLFAGGRGIYDEYFRNALRKYPETTVVVVDQDVLWEVESFIIARDYSPRASISGYTVFWK